MTMEKATWKGTTAWSFLWSLMIIASTITGVIVGKIMKSSPELLKDLPTVRLTAGPTAGVAFFFCIGLMIIISNWKEVPEKYCWVIEFMGQYMDTWEAGPHLMFPILMKIRKPEGIVGIMEGSIPFFLDDEKIEQDYGRGNVDFRDGSTPVEATVFYKIVDATKAVYGTDDVIEKMAKIMDALIGGYLVHFTVEEANQLRSQMTLSRMVNEQLPPKDADEEFVTPIKFPSEEIYEDKDVWKKMVDNWGVEVLSIKIQDIRLVKTMEDARQKVLVAEKDEEAAEHTKQAAIKVAEGLATGAKALIGAGLSKEDAAMVLAANIQWTSISEGNFDKVLVTGQDAGQGARLGAGIKAAE